MLAQIYLWELGAIINNIGPRVLNLSTFLSLMQAVELHLALCSQEGFFT